MANKTPEYITLDALLARLAEVGKGTKKILLNPLSPLKKKKKKKGGTIKK